MTETLQYKVRTRTRKEQNCLLILLLYAIIFGFLSFSQNTMAVPFAIIAIFTSVFYSQYLSLAIYVCTMVVAPEFSNTQLVIIMAEVMAVGFFILNKSKIAIRRLLVIDFLFVIYLVFGLAIGRDSQMITILLYSFNLFMSVFIAQIVSDSDDNLIMYSLLCGGIIVSLITLHIYLTGQFVLMRIDYQGNSKDLSTVIVIPIFLAFNKILNYKNNKNQIETLFYLAVFFMLLPLLLLTYSRGVTLSLIAASGLLYLHSTKGFKIRNILIFLVLGYFVYHMIDNMDMSARMWFDNLEGGNGRTDIWRKYFSAMEREGTGTMLLGFGTASQKDTLEWYPHSLILAHYFHFGVFGFLFILYQIATPMLALFKQRREKAFYLYLLVLCAMMYFPHGTYNEALFWVIIGISFGMARKKLTNIQKR